MLRPYRLTYTVYPLLRNAVVVSATTTAADANKANDFDRLRPSEVEKEATIIENHPRPKRRKEETEDERRMRLFWESRSFPVAEHVIERVLKSCQQHKQLMQPLDDVESPPIFAQFYEGAPLLLPHKKSSQRSSLQTNKENHHKETVFRLEIAYAGQHFCGWSHHPLNSRPSVEAVLQDAIDDDNVKTDGWKGYIKGTQETGRTAKDSHAVGQVARLRVQRQKNEPRKPVRAENVFETLEAAAEKANYTWRCLSVTETSKKVYPIARSYVYLVDASNLAQQLSGTTFSDDSAAQADDELLGNVVERIRNMLRALEEKELDFHGFSLGRRRNYTTCSVLHHASARLLLEPTRSAKVLAIELTAERFLMKMPNILVSTALSLLASKPAVGDDDRDLLIRICEERTANRQLTAKPAPANGLVYLGPLL